MDKFREMGNEKFRYFYRFEPIETSIDPPAFLATYGTSPLSNPPSYLLELSIPFLYLKVVGNKKEGGSRR